MNPESPRILILRLSALGDIIHALPLAGELRAHWPNAFIGWLCEPAGAQIVQGHPLLNRVHVVPKQAWRANKLAALRGPLRALAAELRATRYDTTIDAQGLTKSALWARLSRAPRRIGFAGREAREFSPLLNNLRISPDPQRLHVAERNLALLRGLGLEPPASIRFPVHLPDPARRRAAEILGPPDDRNPFMLIAPGAGWATKIWPAERFGCLARALVQRFAARVAFSWGPGEQSLVADALRAAGEGSAPDFGRRDLPTGPGIHPLPSTTFIELGAVIARARLFVGGDTGPTHLAAALEIPTVSMMGPLDARRNGPYGAKSLTIQHAVPRHAPWWRNHRRWCDPATDLRRVSVEEVLAACEKKLR